MPNERMRERKNERTVEHCHFKEATAGVHQSVGHHRRKCCVHHRGGHFRSL